MGSRALRNPTTLSLFTTLSTHFRSRRYASSTEFERLVQARCKSRELTVTEALGYFNFILEMKPMPSIWALNQLLGWLSKSKQFSTVVSMYKHLRTFRSLDFHPDASTMNIILKCLARSSGAKSGFSVLGAMIKTGVRHDSHTLCTLLDGLCKEGSMIDAMGLFRKIEKDVVTYGTVINGFYLSGESQKAFELLKQMLNCDRTKPDTFCFSIVINCLCKDGLIDEALGLFQTMTNIGVRPDFFIFTSLIHVSYKLGRREEAQKLLLDMIDFGSLPDVYTYTTIINSLCKDDKLEAAASLFEDMVNRGVVPNTFCYNTLVVGFAKLGLWKEVARILEHMKGHGVSPNIVTFSSILDARFKEGSTMAALHLVGVMAEKRILLETAFSSSFFSGLSRTARSEEAEILSDITVNSDIVADVHILNILLNGLSAGFMVLEARRLFEVMVDRGQVDTISFTTMINGHCLQGEMEKAEEVFDLMEINGVFPNTVTYNILANGYLKAGRIDDAVKILKVLVSKGLLPDKVTRSILKIIHAVKHESALGLQAEGEERWSGSSGGF